MKPLFYFKSLLFISLIAWCSCAKWKDKPAQNLGLTNKYCNNPNAINYNWGFPGVEDSTVCIFPADPFVGSYSYQDSLYLANGILDSSYVHLITFNINKTNFKQFSLSGFCSSSNLFFSADRYYNANSDSIIGAGQQLMCRSLDTLTGNLLYRTSDSSMTINFTVVSDTGITYHKGTAYKQH